MRKANDSSGFTLIELLVVMSIIAVIAGVAVGMVRRRDRTLTLEVNAKLVRSALRLARNSALDAGTGSIVRFDFENGKIETAAVERGGNWHFEDDTGSRNTKIQGALNFVEGGKLGRCLEITGGEIDLGAYPWYAALNGFLFTIWVNPDALVPAQIFEREQCFKLKMRDDGGLNAELQVGPQGDVVVLETRRGLLSAGRWHRISLAYDRIDARIEVDGVLRALKKEQRQLAIFPAGRLRIGSPDSAFKGKVDEARYEVVLDSQLTDIGVGVDILPTGDPVIAFDGQGRLDARVHAKEARIILATDKAQDDDERATDTIRVELTGAIR